MESTKLFFPIWMAFIVPISWWTIVPGLFLLALLACFAAHFFTSGGENRLGTAWGACKKCLVKGFLTLLLTWISGTLIMLAPSFFAIGAEEGGWLRSVSDGLLSSIYSYFPSFLWALGAAGISAAVAYLLGRVWIFGKSDCTGKKSLLFSLISAPWLFLVTHHLYY